MADPVEAKSDFLRMYMSSHPETLVAYIRWFGKVKEDVSSATLNNINSKNMTLTCLLRSGAKKTVQVNFKPPLSDYEAVKPRLLEMKALAQEGLGIIKRPRVTTFKFPRKNFVSICFYIGFVVYCYLAPINSSLLSLPALAVRKYAGDAFVDYQFYVIGAIHVVEGIYTVRLCWKYRTPFLVGLNYVLFAFMVGYPSWGTLEDHVRDIRIESVMKIQ